MPFASGAFYHVTPLKNLPAIQAQGLRVDPPERHWQTAQVIYLTRSEAEAQRWAAEIARRLGGPTEFALLRVNPWVPGASGLVAEKTGIRAIQYKVRWNIPADHIAYLGAFTAAPRHGKELAERAS